MAGTATHNAHMYYLLLPDLTVRTEFISRLKREGINCVFHYVPLHSAPAGQRFGRVHGDMNVTDQISGRLVRLPLWLGLEEQQAEVIRHILACLQS